MTMTVMIMRRKKEKELVLRISKFNPCKSNEQCQNVRLDDNDGDDYEKTKRARIGFENIKI